MESREASSAMPQEDESNLSNLAKEAASMFQSRRYHECLDILNQLLQKKADDPKVLHNIAVAEYFRDGCTDPQNLLEVLAKVKKRSEELVRAAGEQLEGTGNPPNTSSTLTSKGNTVGGGQQSASPNSDGVAYMDEYDTSIAALNTAVIFYHLQQYANAMSVLEPLYQNIEPIDETAAFRICLLMLDITLASREAAKAADVLQYMEKAFGFGYLITPADNGGNAQYQSSGQAFKSTPAIPTNQAVAEGASGATTINATSAPIVTTNAESTLSRTLSEEALDYEALLSTLDIDGQNLGRPAAPLSMSSDLTRTAIERPPPASDLKLILHLYKVRLLLLTRNLKATKREVKLAMNIARGRDSSTALLLKAQLEYSRNNHRKALKLLTTCNSRAEQGMSCMIFNNLGCIHHQLRKGHIAVLYFSKASESCASLGVERPIKLATFSQDKSLSIMYNRGLQHLMCGKPLDAAYCFQKASCIYYNQPLIWIRLAECCILALEKGLLKSSKSDVSVRGDELKVHVVGNGKWRRIVLPDGISTATSGDINSDLEQDPYDLNCLPASSEEGVFVLGQPAKLSTAFARQCLLISLFLLNRLDAKDAKPVASSLSNEKKDDEDSNQAATVGCKIPSQKNVTTGESKGVSNVITGATTQVNANGDGKESKGNSGSASGSGSSSTICASVAAYEEMQRKENMATKQAILADLAFVELCLENPLKALTTAETLLQQPECSGVYTFLGHIYAAESLCHLNRPKEAAEHLSICMAESNTVELSFNGAEDNHKWRSAENSEASGDGEDISNPVGCNSSMNVNLSETSSNSYLTGGQARATLYVNLASVLAMQGDLQQAYQFATQAVSLMPTNPLAVLSVVYVELLQGKNQEAISRLKQCRHLRVVNSNAMSCST